MLRGTARRPLKLCISISSSRLSSKMAQPPRKTAISPSTFNDYNSQLQIAVLKATKNAAALPGDITFYTSMDKSLSQEVDATSNRTLSVMNDLLNLVSEKAAVERRKRPRLEGMEDVQDNFRSLVDIMDQLLERTVCDRLFALFSTFSRDSQCIGYAS